VRADDERHEQSPLESVRLRAATLADLDRIMVIERASFAAPWPEVALVEEIEGRSWSRVIVAEADGAIIGFMVYWVIDLELHLLNLATLPAWRRRGIARALVARLIADAERGGRDEILLEVRRSNRAARRLYRSLGFTDFDVRRRYYRDNNEDAVVMLKQL
jgi:ribosomal-protein-alanine N-acetyltransferase